MSRTRLSCSGKPNVIVNRRTALFVTRIKHVLVARARDQGRSPAQTIIAAEGVKGEALEIGLGDKETQRQGKQKTRDRPRSWRHFHVSRILETSK
jgi:hypothetical protein